MTLLFACACGAIGGNIYHAQSLLVACERYALLTVEHLSQLDQRDIHACLHCTADDIAERLDATRAQVAAFPLGCRRAGGPELANPPYGSCDPNPEALRGRASRQATFYGSDHARATILGQRFRHACRPSCGAGMVNHRIVSAKLSRIGTFRSRSNRMTGLLASPSMMDSRPKE
jgi:hypothetical protein